LTFLFWKLFIVCVKSFFGYRKVSKKERNTTIQLLWNKHKYQLNFKEFQHGFDEATVRDLKEKCKQVTNVPIASMKLQVSGGNKHSCFFLKKKDSIVLTANIKDDTATLTSVGVCRNSTVVLNGEQVDVNI
jgi:hypothetical protein